MNKIGRLIRVDLREVWKREASDFTQWLQQNIEVLGSALDINLVNVEREQAAGSFSIDLVAEDEGGGTIIIENQLGKSDHDHLGKLITYLTAMEAKAAIWVRGNGHPKRLCEMNEPSVKSAVGRMQSADTRAAGANGGFHPPYGSSPRSKRR